MTKLGVMCIKYHPINLAGMPDRLILLHNAKCVWVELKDTGKAPRPLQLYRHQQLRALGQVVFVVDSDEGIKRVADYVRHQ